jgi:hypothetical protein
MKHFSHQYKLADAKEAQKQEEDSEEEDDAMLD